MSDRFFANTILCVHVSGVRVTVLHAAVGRIMGRIVACLSLGKEHLELPNALILGADTPSLGKQLQQGPRKERKDGDSHDMLGRVRSQRLREIGTQEQGCEHGRQKP